MEAIVLDSDIRPFRSAGRRGTLGRVPLDGDPMSIRRWRLGPGLFSLLVAAGVFSPLRAEPLPFPSPPSAADRVARSDAEREAGVVILEAETQLSGEVKLGATIFSRLKGSVSRQHRLRYLVLDAKGVEHVARHAFLGEGKSDIHDLRGRTVTADGQEYAVDPEKDVRNLDRRDPTGKPRGAVRSVIFPNVAPGAVLDVSWSEESTDVPDFESVILQSEFPIRHRSLKVRGLLFKTSAGKAFWLGGPTAKFYWVPFFAGPVPPRAHATLDGQFNLTLEIRDVPPYVEEPYAPPIVRTAYVLGLMPRPVDVMSPSAAERDRRRGFVLFGPRDRGRMSGPDATVSQDIDPEDSFVRLDPLALQSVPGWQSDNELMKWHQSVLRGINKNFYKFFKRTGKGEIGQDVSAIAPPDLAWQERARRLFDHARSRVKPDPEAETQTRLADLLHAGKGRARDVALYLSYLFDQAGIPARIVMPLSHYAIPFQPLIESFDPFDIGYLVEVGPPAKGPSISTPAASTATSRRSTVDTWEAWRSGSPT